MFGAASGIAKTWVGKFILVGAIIFAVATWTDVIQMPAREALGSYITNVSDFVVTIAGGLIDLVIRLWHLAAEKARSL